MKLKIGIVDIALCVVVAVVLLLPKRSLQVEEAFPAIPEVVREIDVLQLRLHANPGDGVSAEKLADQLATVGHSDWALDIAQRATQQHSSPTRWRALRALATARIVRMWTLGKEELVEATHAAQKALSSCMEPSAICTAEDQLLLRTELDWLQRGHTCGDPSVSAKKFQKCVGAPLPSARFLMGRGKTSSPVQGQ